MAEIFISYSSKDIDWVSNLAKHLESDGFDIWWDRKLNTGSLFLDEINKKLQESSVVLVIWSDFSMESRWVQGEVQEAYNSNKQTVPVFLKKIKLKIPHNTVQVLSMENWTGEKDELYKSLKSTLLKKLKISQETSESERVKIDGFQETVRVNIRGKNYYVSVPLIHNEKRLENLLLQLEKQRSLLKLSLSQMKQAYIDKVYLKKLPVMVNHDSPIQQAILSHLLIQNLIPVIQLRGGKADFKKSETLHVKLRVEIMINTAEKVAHIERSKFGLLYAIKKRFCQLCMKICK